ncbi:hypothetical protein DXG03_009129 [Asterophora parasitica]|uniref:S-adenosylmethionine-dependent methyltransferase n=1 Tax=Asterophora parasitica TaxID=117018 RepID=A0A9P7GB87_9AGAR|nr:hypothetical protein DXG03_009129 [Asterophora parasitica]
MDVTDFSSHPTSFLPPLARLSSKSTQDITDALGKVRALYWPPKPPPLPAKITLPKRMIARLIHDKSVPDSGYASAEEESDEDCISGGITHVAADTREADRLEFLRADHLEREFAIKWTTGFIARSSVWIDLAPSPEENAARHILLDDATALLSAFISGDDGSKEYERAIVRTFSFPTSSGTPVTVQLTDEALLEDDHTSVGLQSWGSCILLGERISLSPASFSLTPRPDLPRPLRVLELGAGTGLLSILAAKLLFPVSPHPTVVATDYHPSVLTNLAANVAGPGNAPAAPVHVHLLDWETPKYDAPLDTPFDVVLAADVIYHPDHARWLRGCVERLLARPGPENPEGGVFWMIIAVRSVGRHEGLDGTVTAVFGGEDEGDLNGGGGVRLAVLETEVKEKVEGVGRADETGYKLFKIGWKAVISGV